MIRRDAIKDIILASLAPVYIVNGLMRIKSIVEVNWMDSAMLKLRKNGIKGPYTFVVHPDLYNNLLNNGIVRDDIVADYHIVTDKLLTNDLN